MSIDRLTTNPAAGFSDAVTISGPGRVIHLTTNHGLEFLPRDTARAKMSVLAAVRDRARQEFP